MKMSSSRTARAAERLNSDLAGHPVLVCGTSRMLARGMGGVNENSLININIKHKSHSIAAQVIVPEDRPCEGGNLSQGRFAGGWILYVKDGRLTYCYNFVVLLSPAYHSEHRVMPGSLLRVR